MKLVAFSVKNYRSIIEAREVNLNNYNVLIGKNNEGKSNMLRALYLCMAHISRYNYVSTDFEHNYMTERMLRIDKRYKWNNDFPISLRNRKQGRKSIFNLLFELNANELKDLNKEINVNIKTNEIKIHIEFDEESKATISFPKKGTNSLTRRSLAVMHFLSNRIQYIYIPAVRTEEQASRLIEENITNQLEELEENDEYKNALEKVKELQEKYLTQISQVISDELKEFIPKVKKVKINPREKKGLYSSTMQILIDDGTLTDMDYKGDGIKSLVVLALLKNRKLSNNISNIIAIDEPEAHLHQGAIDELIKTMKELSKNNQIIISTHNGLFTNFTDISDNLIINDGKVKPAKNISQIRDVLGIKSYDNLTNARFVLLVEGENDEKSLYHILPLLSKKIKNAIDNRILIIESTNGASKSEFYISSYKRNLCIPILFLDNDKEGINVANRLKANYKDILLCNVPGMKESEFEDMINEELYEKEIYEKTKIKITKIKNVNKSKWSDRMRILARIQCKPMNDEIINEMKCIVKENVIKCNNKEEMFARGRDNPINVLVDTIENYLKEI